MNADSLDDNLGDTSISRHQDEGDMHDWRGRFVQQFAPPLRSYFTPEGLYHSRGVSRIRGAPWGQAGID